jgi:hypothetical protein
MKEFIGLLVLASFIPAATFAADMPIPAPQPPPSSLFSWPEWYVGGNAGYWASSTPPNIFDSPGFAGVVSPSGGNLFPWLSPNGFIGGPIDYDWQVTPQMGGPSRY